MSGKWYLPAQNFVHHHPECVTVRVFRLAAVLEIKLFRVEEFWAHPSRCATWYKRVRGRGVRDVQRDCEQTEVRKAGVTILIDQDIGLGGQNSSERGKHRLSETYPFKITVDHSLTVHINQAPRDISQLPRLYLSRTIKGTRSYNGKLTSSNRFSRGWAFTYSLIFPFSIHSDTIANLPSAIITPSSGNTFGW